MRVDTLVANQLLMAQAVDSLADHIANSISFQFTPVTFANLPPTPSMGMMAVVTDDSGPPTWGSIVTGGGSGVVLAWYNGTDWTVVGK